MYYGLCSIERFCNFSIENMVLYSPFWARPEPIQEDFIEEVSIDTYYNIPL